MSGASDSEKTRKKAYRAPRLLVYGSVRELTGSNSGLLNGDSNTMMAMA